MGALRDPRHEKYAQLRAERVDRLKAYAEAGYVPDRGNAKRLEQRKDVRARIHELVTEAAEYTDVRRARVIVEIDRVGRANMRDFYKKDGSLIPVHELPRGLAAAIAEVKVNDDGEIEGYRLHDRNQANTTLLKHLGGLPEPERPDVNIFNLLDVEDQRALADALEALARGQGGAGEAASG